jgi:hypothetical protein
VDQQVYIHVLAKVNERSKKYKIFLESQLLLPAIKYTVAPSD